jgi:putative methyltransferase (TIGR04325 family)
LLKQGIYFSGNYPDWASAQRHSSGYDAALILDRVKQARLEVMAGRAVYERDSAIFDEVKHSFPVLAGLLRAAIENGNQLSVLDFGGSLGSTYFQCRDFLSIVSSLRWSIVEQERFVDCGREQFETEQLKFYYSIAECIQQAKPNVVLFSSVLQYLPEPYLVLDEVIRSNIPYVIIDRTPSSNDDGDRIAVQHVPPSIYKASYPMRIFGGQSLHGVFRDQYQELAQFESNWDGSSSEICSGLEFRSRGMILRKR